MFVLSSFLPGMLFVCATSWQGSGNSGAPELDPMEEEKDNDEVEEEVKAEEDDDRADEEKRKADSAEEPPAFGVEGEGGDSSVLEAAKQEVSFSLLFVSFLGLVMQHRPISRLCSVGCAITGDHS